MAPLCNVDKYNMIFISVRISSNRGRNVNLHEIFKFVEYANNFKKLAEVTENFANSKNSRTTLRSSWDSQTTFIKVVEAANNFGKFVGLGNNFWKIRKIRQKLYEVCRLEGYIQVPESFSLLKFHSFKCFNW